jgi:1-acyl-sn-glycerol-3-phosphate acyltransferase
MIRLFGRLIMRIGGWKRIGYLPPYKKCIIVVAPHTSMIDFFIGKLYFWSAGLRAHFLIKKEVFVFPMNLLLRAAGAIPVKRGAKNNMVDQLTEQFNTREDLILIITPEGTRKKTRRWKRGFILLGMKANIPIILGKIDYKKKEVGLTRVFVPTGDVDEDLKGIQKSYRGVTARHPENFTTGYD